MGLGWLPTAIKAVGTIGNIAGTIGSLYNQFKGLNQNQQQFDASNRFNYSQQQGWTAGGGSSNNWNYGQSHSESSGGTNDNTNRKTELSGWLKNLGSMSAQGIYNMAGSGSHVCNGSLVCGTAHVLLPLSIECGFCTVVCHSFTH